MGKSGIKFFFPNIGSVGLMPNGIEVINRNPQLVAKLFRKRSFPASRAAYNDYSLH
jgi:hypothetical protein